VEGGEDDDDDGGLAAAAARGEERVPELYDDADFYEQLLKEFLEASGDVGGLAAAAAKPEKRRKAGAYTRPSYCST